MKTQEKLAECHIPARKELGTHTSELNRYQSMAGSGKSKLCCEGGKVIPQGLLHLEPPQYLLNLVYTFRPDSRGLSRWPGKPHDPHLWLEQVGAKQVRLEVLV